jgi:hypothetical protein
MISCGGRSTAFLLLVPLLLTFRHSACGGAMDTTAAHLPDSSVVESGRDSVAIQPDNTIDAGRLAIVGGVLAGGITTIHLYQATGWWKDNKSPFHFQEDLRYGLWVDKIGHFYGATALTFVFRKSLEWANFTEESALHWGAGAAAIFQTYVEVEDGFHTWGFDRVDFASDIAGAAYPIAQYYWKPLRDFNFKFSYHTSPLLNKKGTDTGFKGQKHIMMDDYEGQTLWLSVSVHNLLPKSAAEFWPPWLCLAFGYGGRNIASTDANGPYRVYFLALDLDVKHIIPQETQFLRTLSEALNFIRLPLPAVRIAPGAVWYGFYF